MDSLPDAAEKAEKLDEMWYNTISLIFSFFFGFLSQKGAEMETSRFDRWFDSFVSHPEAWERTMMAAAIVCSAYACALILLH